MTTVLNVFVWIVVGLSLLPFALAVVAAFLEAFFTKKKRWPFGDWKHDKWS